MYNTFTIENNKCPFCNNNLTKSHVKLPDNKILPCLECKSCKSYFYTITDYFTLKDYARQNNSKLYHQIYTYIEKTKISIKKKKPQVKQNKKIKIKHVNSASLRIEIQKVSTPLYTDETCYNYRNGYCIYTNKNCNISSFGCQKYNNTRQKPKIIYGKRFGCKYYYKNYCTKLHQKCDIFLNGCIKSYNAQVLRNGIPLTEYSDKSSKLTSSNQILNVHCALGVNTIVLTYNKKCTIESHPIIDIESIIRIASPNGDIIEHHMPAAYCKICKLFFVLKSDFKIAKQKGVILCPVIDATKIHPEINLHNYKIGNESKIHAYGYNVQQGFGYTDKQRQIILANIIDNCSISKHEIASHINSCIQRHKSQKNYSVAVAKWEKDLMFVNNYKQGTIKLPKVLIDKVTIGRRN